jgi:hypothetical protein
MMHCRTDVSIAMKTASWFILPFPFQWGIPIFHWKSACIMIVASVISSVNSVRHFITQYYLRVFWNIILVFTISDDHFVGSLLHAVASILRHSFAFMGHLCFRSSGFILF